MCPKIPHCLKFPILPIGSHFMEQCENIFVAGGRRIWTIFYSKAYNTKVVMKQLELDKTAPILQCKLHSNFKMVTSIIKICNGYESVESRKYSISTLLMPISLKYIKNYIACTTIKLKCNGWVQMFFIISHFRLPLFRTRSNIFMLSTATLK